MERRARIVEGELEIGIKNMLKSLLAIPPMVSQEYRNRALKTLEDLEALDRKILREYEAREIVNDVIMNARRSRNKKEMKKFSSPALAEKFFQKTLACVEGPKVSPLKGDFDKVRKHFGLAIVPEGEEQENNKDFQEIDEMLRLFEKSIANNLAGRPDSPVGLDPAKGEIEIIVKYKNEDPLTKQKIRNPVKNKFCSHVYDKESILNFIKINEEIDHEGYRKMKNTCPFRGCGNKNYLDSRDLDDFPEFFDTIDDDGGKEKLNEITID